MSTGELISCPLHDYRYLTWGAVGVLPVFAGHIDLAVPPDYRRLGIHLSRIKEMIGILRESGYKSVFLEVRVSNEEARKMYEKFGVCLLGTRKNYYVSSVEDAFEMVLRFMSVCP